MQWLIKYVGEAQQKEARKKLAKRMRKGEDPYIILKIADKYYVNKIINGFVKISEEVYERIMYHQV